MPFEDLNFRHVFQAVLKEKDQESVWLKSFEQSNGTVDNKQLLRKFIWAVPNEWCDDDHRMFWKHFCACSFTRVVQSLGINIIGLLAIIVYCLAHLQINQLRYQTNFFSIICWFLCSVICLVFFIGQKWFGNLELMLEMSKFLARAIVTSRIFLVVIRVINIINNRYCDADKCTHIAEFCFLHPLVEVLLNSIQAMLYVTLPFPWPFGGMLAATELVSQCLWIYLASLKNSWGHWIAPYCFGSVCVVAVMSYLGNLSTIQAAADDYIVQLNQVQISGEKKKFVNLLCSEIRAPLQCIVSATAVIDPRFLAEKDRLKIQMVTREIMFINQLADDLLTIVKIAEGRMRFECSSTFSIKKLIQGLFTRFSIRCSTMSINITDSITTDEHFLRVLLSSMIALVCRTQNPNCGLLDEILIRTLRVSLVNSPPGANDHEYYISVCIEAYKSMSYTFARKDSIAMTTCHCLTAVAGGDCTTSLGANTIQCTVKCQMPTKATSNGGGGCVSSNNNNNKPFRRKSERMLTASLSTDHPMLELKPAPKFADLKSLRVFVLSDNSNLTSCLVDTLLNVIKVQTCTVEHSIAKFGGFNNSNCDVIFVSDACMHETIRLLGYKNRLVMFTGSHAYLDDEDIKNYDYIINIPILDNEVHTFSDWLSRLQPSMSDLSDTNTRNITPKNRVWAPLQWLWVGVNVFFDTSASVEKISIAEEMLLTWRLLCPKQSTLNYSNLQDFKIVGYVVIVSISMCCDHNVNMDYRYSVLALVGVMFVQSRVYKYIRCFLSNVKLVYIMSGCTLLIMAAQISIIPLMYYYQPRSDIDSDPNSISLKHLFHTQLGRMSSLFVVESMTESLIGLLPWAISLPAPLTHYYGISLCFRLIGAVFLIARLTCPAHVYWVVMGLVILFCALRTVIHYNLDKTSRQQYLRHRSSVCNQLVLKGCFNLCRRDISGPIGLIADFKSEFITIIRDSVPSRFPLSRELIRHVRWFKYGQLTLTDLLAVHSHKSENDNTSQSVMLTSDMGACYRSLKCVYVEQELAQITTSLLVNFHLTYDLDCTYVVDPNLTFVVIDLTDFIHKVYMGFVEAKKHIDQTVRGQRDRIESIMIRLVGDPLCDTKNFSDIRQLTIEFIDTGTFSTACASGNNKDIESSSSSFSSSPILALALAAPTEEGMLYRSRNMRSQHKSMQKYTMNYSLSMKSFDARRYNTGSIHQCTDEFKPMIDKCLLWIKFLTDYESRMRCDCVHSKPVDLRHCGCQGLALFVQPLAKYRRVTSVFARHYGWKFHELASVDDIMNFPVTENVDVIFIDSECHLQDADMLGDVDALRCLGYKMVIVGIFDSLGEEQCMEDSERFDLVIKRSQLDRSAKDIINACVKRSIHVLT